MISVVLADDHVVVRTGIKMEASVVCVTRG